MKPQNYCQISILPIVTKIFERLLHKQIGSYFEKILSPSLSSYRKSTSSPQNIESLSLFNDKIKNLILNKCTFRLRKCYLEDIGFLEIM